MALRAREGPAPERKSAKVGDRLEFRAKVENTAAGEERVTLHVEDLKEGALARPVDFEFVFEPVDQPVAPKGRTPLAWAWTAALPAGKTAFTFRGKVALRRAMDGTLLASAPLDLYVTS